MKSIKRGRPPLPAEEKASELIPGFRVTLSQEKRYRKAAKAKKLTLAAWLKYIGDLHS